MEQEKQTQEVSLEEAAEIAQERMEARLNALIRDPLLTHIRSLPTIWAKMKEKDQQSTITAIEETARMVIREACHIIAKRGFDSMGIRLKDFTVKDGHITGKFDASMGSDHVQLLADHASQAATIVFIDPAAFMNGEWAKADPDEPGLPLEGEEEDDDDQRRAAGGRAGR